MIYESESIKLSHVENYIYHQYFGLVDAKEWKEAFSVGVKYYNQHNLTCWLNDLSQFWGTDCENVIWLQKNVNLGLKKLEGLHKMAFVPPDERFEEANRSMNFYIQYSNADFIGHGVLIERFQTLNQAQDWLKM